VARDVRERKRAEEALRESEERFQQVAENASGMDREVDAHGSHLCKSNSGKDTWS